MVTSDITLAIAVLGAATGVLGSALGILNTWRSFDRDRVKLRVTPSGAIFSRPVCGATDLLCIEVVNIGFVPVTVSQVAFKLRRPRKRILVFIPVGPISDTMPHRLEPHTSMKVLVPPNVLTDEAFQRVSRAFAKTQCGKTFYGASGCLDSFIKRAAAGEMK